METDRQTDRQTDGRTDGLTVGARRTDGRPDRRRTDGRLDGRRTDAQLPTDASCCAVVVNGVACYLRQTDRAPLQWSQRIPPHFHCEPIDSISRRFVQLMRGVGGSTRDDEGRIRRPLLQVGWLETVHGFSLVIIN